MSVYMRSNDIWYGFCNDQYQFSSLQKMIAERLSIDVGWYYHHAHNMHLYNNKLINMYYLYHIPGKKIGVTRNLNNRVTLIQGYKEDEYEVLEQSDDIDYISDREIELQKSYGYQVDLEPYKKLI